MKTSSVNATVILRAVALAIATVVLGILHAATVETQAALLSLGLLALALAEMQKSTI